MRKIWGTLFALSSFALADECYELPLGCDDWSYGWSILPYVGQENLGGMPTVPGERLTWVVTMINFQGDDHCDVEGVVKIRWFINLEQPLGSYGPYEVYLAMGDMVLLDNVFHMVVPDNINEFFLIGRFDGYAQTCPLSPTFLEFNSYRPITHPADVTRDFQIDDDDIMAILEFWGAYNFRADINNDNIVDITDLLEVIINYGWSND